MYIYTLTCSKKVTFVYVGYLSQHNNLQLQLFCCSSQDFIFYGRVILHCTYIPPFLHTLLHWWALRLLSNLAIVNGNLVLHFYNMHCILPSLFLLAYLLNYLCQIMSLLRTKFVFSEMTCSFIRRYMINLCIMINLSSQLSPKNLRAR